jgi:uncharacterized protein (DUF885 family)
VDEPTETTPGAEAARRSREVADAFWERLLEHEPVLGTAVGDERFDDRLPDPSEEGRNALETMCRESLTAAAEIDRAGLDVVMRTTLDVLDGVARRYLAAIEHRTDRLVPANHNSGPSQLLGDLASLQRVDTPERAERYRARLRAIPAYLEASETVMADGVAAGVTVPTVVAERCLGLVERIVRANPEESPALSPVPESDREPFVEIVRDTVSPAYERYLVALQDYLPHTTETIALSALPGGEAMYGAEILSWTTLPLDAREVHELGVERFDAIMAERIEVAGLLGYDSPNDAVAARNAAGENAAATPNDLVELAKDQVRRSWEAAPGYFGMMPSVNCEVRPVEEFREADVPAAFYYPPTEDGERPGVYYVNTYDLEHRYLHHVAAITYHEASPGHHFQIAIEQEIPNRPALRRFGGLMAGSAFAEGWGLYSERLADEMGLYLDEWERLGMLEAQAHRAARLITDTGIHALGWTREAAIAKLEDAGLPPVDAAIEIDRYIGEPAQALCYMIGMIEIERAREAATAREGSDFSLKSFHDQLLSLGQLPLPALRRELGSAS